MPYLLTQYGNPSSHYELGRTAKSAVNTAKEQIASLLNCSPDEIFFTSGGSEADNLAIKGLFFGRHYKRAISQTTEHHAVLNVLKEIENYGAEVIRLPVNSDGLIGIDDLLRHLNNDVSFVSIMTLNNEIGVAQNIGDIGDICRKYGIPFHTDAVQAVGHFPIDVKYDHIDLLSASGHKFGAPKGIGFLYINKDWQLSVKPLINGGGQERGMRAGTENVASIVGIGKAAELAKKELESDINERTNAVFDYFRKQLKYRFPALIENALSSPTHDKRHLNVSFMKYGIRGEQLVHLLDEQGICVSSGSACNSDAKQPSHVLKAIGRSDPAAESSIRFSISESTTMEDVDLVMNALNAILFLIAVAAGTSEISSLN